MTQLVIVVLAIILGALLVAGGISYFDAGLGSRIQISQGLATQQEALSAGVSTYMSANGSVAPSSIARVEPYLVGGEVPRPPKGAEALSWSMASVSGGRVLCLSGNPSGLDRDVVQGVISFARDAARREPIGTVSFGGACGEGNSDPESFSTSDFQPTALAVTFRGR